MMLYEEVVQGLAEFHLPAWEELPDFGLYMDQMVTYVSRVYPGAGGRLDITPNMINNYVKAGLISKPAGKKYAREALAQLLMIAVMKVATPLDVMKKLLHPEEDISTEEMYTSFARDQQTIREKIFARGSIPALDYALESSLQQLALRMMQE